MDVVIIGAGPVGLCLASELALAGVKAVVLERLAEPDRTIKAGSIGALAGEALERRGLGARMNEIENDTLSKIQFNPTQRKNMGGHFAGLFLLDQSLQREPERRARFIPQFPLETMLGEHAKGLGVEVRRGVEMESFTESEAGIDITLTNGEKLRTKWLVGCDGGRSRVRKGAGIDFVGTDATITGHQAVATIDHPDRLLPTGWRRTQHGMFSWGPTPGRFVTVQFDGTPVDRNAPVTKDELEAALRHVSGADVRILDLQTCTRWTDNARQAPTYRRGRVLLCGDAAHVHSPFGGQGLQLGILDATNLAFKLAAVLAGAAETFLDSYTTERHPIAAVALENSRAQVALMRPDEQVTALRDLFTEMMKTPEGNRVVGDRMNGVQTRYDVGSSDPRVGRFFGDKRLYEHMRDGKGLLVGAKPEHPKHGRLRSLLCADVDEPMLIRPDGCIAWIGEDGLGDAIARWFP